MADTGSEMAESATKDTTGIAVRLLERHFLWRGGDQEGGRQRQAEEEEGRVAIDVRCPIDGFDERAHEVLEAMERAHVRVSATFDESLSTVVLSMPAKDVERAQRALERLHASEKSGFTLEDVTGLQLVEAVTGRRTLGADSFDTTPAPEAPPAAEPVESSTVTFANHPTEPERDRAHAEAYARGMREMGFDAEARTVATTERDTHGNPGRGTESVVAVSYPVRDREDFAVASLLVLHEVGALVDLAGEDPYLSDVKAYERDRERLMASVGSRRADVMHNVDATSGAPDKGEWRSVRESNIAAGDAKPGAKGMTPEEYDSLPVRERAKIDPRDIPDGAFGRRGIRETAAQAAAAAAVLAADREPARTHPAIGERVN